MADPDDERFDYLNNLKHSGLKSAIDLDTKGCLRNMMGGGRSDSPHHR